MNSRANLIKGELEIDTTWGVKGNTLIVTAPSMINKTDTPDHINTVERV